MSTDVEKSARFLEHRNGRLATVEGRTVKSAPDRVRELVARAFVGKRVEARIEGGSVFFIGRVTGVAINFTARSMPAGLVIDRGPRNDAWLSLGQVTSITEVPDER